MSDKQKEFATLIFQKIYGKLNDEDGNPYVEVYQYEIEELVKNMCIDLNTILKVFGDIHSGDVAKVFALHFWDTDAIVDYDIEDTELAFKFDELFGDSIGDKPTFGRF